MTESLTSRSLRERLGSFLAPTCRVLLNRTPQLGLRLWKTIHNHENSSIAFDTIDIAFRAEDSSESNIARKLILDECWSDASIARVAFTCTAAGCEEWLEKTIEELLSAERPWRKLKGLALASFSEMSLNRFEALVSSAALTDRWTEQSLSPLRENIRKNQLARYWYSVFLTAEDRDAAWGAFQVVLSLADERLLHWRAGVEKECAGSEWIESRLRFLELGWNGKRELRKEIDRENIRKELLFGLKYPRGEIVPFMKA